MIAARIQSKDPANRNWLSASWVPQDSKETGSVQVGFHKIQRKLGESKLDSTRFKVGDRNLKLSKNNLWTRNLHVVFLMNGKSI